ncbi:lamin tail domain-containing protein [Myxococcota bacterium]|nr:lamin tail domain-containing protein [Myxococcota bacterium]
MQVDPSRGRFEVTSGIAQSAQGLGAVNIVQDGTPNVGPANSVELVTTNAANDLDGTGACGFASSYCGTVAIRSFYTGPIGTVFAEITTIAPAAGHAGLNSDAAPAGLSDALGLWSYGNIGAGGAEARTWVFGDDGTPFVVRGRVMADLCTNGIQDGDEDDVDCGGLSCAVCGPSGGGGTCTDGLQNQGEAGIDCGGPCPNACATCNDGIQNQDETGIDCGGAVCPACAPTCTDGVQNQGETGVDCGGPCPFACNLVINEVDYDNVGTDNAEYIEIFNGTASTVSLANLELRFVNGAAGSGSGVQYRAQALAAAGSLAPGQYLVVASTNVTVDPAALVIRFTATTDNIQNGGTGTTGPDAVGLFDASNGTAIDMLSYEGSLTAGIVTGLGTYNFVEGTATTATDNSTTVAVLVRSPNGRDTNDASADWAVATALTPGSANP